MRLNGNFNPQQQNIFYFHLPQTNRMRWRSLHQHPRRERRRSSRSSSWWHRSAGSRRSPTGPRSPAAASRASASRPIRRSCCPRSWRTSTNGAWTSSLFQNTPTTGLLPASCTPSSRYEPPPLPELCPSSFYFVWWLLKLSYILFFILLFKFYIYRLYNNYIVILFL